MTIKKRVKIKIIECKPKLNQLASNAMKSYGYCKIFDFESFKIDFQGKGKGRC